MPGARFEVRDVVTGHECQTGEGGRGVPLDVRTVGDHGAKPVAEDVAKIADEPLSC